MDQDIKMAAIPNRFTVFMDQTAKKHTYEDGKFAFISETISLKEFKQRFPDEKPLDFGDGDNEGEQYEGWAEDEKVRIAEYFYKEPFVKELVQLATGEVVELKKGLTVEELAVQGYQVVKQRKAHSYRVLWSLISGNKILEGPVVLPGKYIPIVPVLGNEVNKEGMTVATGSDGLLIKKVHLQDSKPMDVAAFLRGHFVKTGFQFK